MNITQNLKDEIIRMFGSEKKFLNAKSNYELNNFSNLNSLQLLKLYDIDSQEVFLEINSKKHLNKMFDMIKSNFFNQKTNHYANLFLNPIKDKTEYEKRKEIFNLKFEFDDESNKKLKDIINSINSLNTKISFNKSIYTLEDSIQKLLYDNYKISAMLITKNDLEQMLSTQTVDFILVTDEDLFVEIDVYSLKDFQRIIVGNIMKKNSDQILKLLELVSISNEFNSQILNSIFKLTGLNLDIDIQSEKLVAILDKDYSSDLKNLTNKALRLEEEVEKINKELKEIISKKKLSLDGDELLELLNSNDLQSLQNKFKEDTKSIINLKEKEILEEFRKNKIKIDFLFSNSSYPLVLDEDVKPSILEQIDSLSTKLEFQTYRELGNFEYKKIKNLFSYCYFFDFFYGLSKFSKKYNLEYPQLGDTLVLIDGKNMYIENPMPISYGLGIDSLDGVSLSGEKISILTGANSGGKTTLLEMFLQAQILTHMGLGISASSKSSLKLFDEIIYLKKFTGTQGSGAFEQTIRNLIEILDNDNSKLILIDEFEAITEPGAAAKILIAFLRELSLQDNYCIGVSHLGQEIKEFIEEKGVKGIRIDGISATGLDEKGNLLTNHQPKFNQLGKSTPELILRRVLQDENFWKGKSKKSREILERIVE